MTQRETARCFFRSCKAPVAYTVHQRWNGKTVHCCEAHKPGSKARPGIDPQAGTFYRIEPYAVR